MAASVARKEFAALRSLRDALSRKMSTAQAELQRRISVLDATVVDLKMQMAPGWTKMAAGGHRSGRRRRAAASWRPAGNNGAGQRVEAPRSDRRRQTGTLVGLTRRDT